MFKRFENYLKSQINKELDARKTAEDENIANGFYSNFKLKEVNRNKMLATSIQRTHNNLTADTPDGVAMDAVCSYANKLNNAYNIALPVDDIIYTFFAAQCFIGFQACSLLTQNWLINKACSLPPKDAIRPNYTVNYKIADDEVIDNDFLTEIKDVSDDKTKYNIREIGRIFAEKKRQFGQVLAYPVIDGVNYSLPFNIDAVKPDSYKGMTVIDPVWYVAELDSEAISKPDSINYFRPTYFVMPDGKKIHYSWCQFGLNGEVPDVLKPTYYWGGYPVPQLIYKRVYAAEKTANEAPMLAMSKRLLVTDINVAAAMTNPAEVQKQIDVLTNYRDNFGVLTKRPQETIQQIDTSLADLDTVIMTQYQLVAAASGVPASKLIETQPKGFNSNGDYEDNQYKMLLASIQEDDIAPLMEMHYQLLCKSKFGLTRYFTVKFDEIDTPTEKERAEINEIQARTDATLVQAGAISPDELRQKLINDENSGYNGLDDEEPEEEPINLEDNGGSSTEQNPFSMDDDTEWRSTENGVHFPLIKGQSTRKSCKAFFKNKNNKQYSEPKNQTETEKYLEKGGYKIKSITPENHVALNDALKDVSDKFELDKIKSINTIDIPSDDLAWSYENEIIIDKSFCNSTKEEIQKAYDSEITNYKDEVNDKLKNAIDENEIKLNKYKAKFNRFGVHTTSDNYFKETILHELGHNIANEKILKTLDTDRKKGIELSNLLQNCYNKSKSNNDIYKLSYVGEENAGEYFAECFVAYNIGEKLPDYAKNMIETFMKKQ